jgi:hypothetical protein
MNKLIVLNNHELLNIKGGGLAEWTSKFVDAVGYYLGAAAANAKKLHESTLFGPGGKTTI